VGGGFWGGPLGLFPSGERHFSEFSGSRIISPVPGCPGSRTAFPEAVYELSGPGKCQRDATLERPFDRDPNRDSNASRTFLPGVRFLLPQKLILLGRLKPPTTPAESCFWSKRPERQPWIFVCTLKPKKANPGPT